jgi:hypothetical protein
VIDLIAFMHFLQRIRLHVRGGFRGIASEKGIEESKAICKKPADY